MVFLKSGSELTVDTQTTGDQSNPNAVQLANGTLAVVWQSNNAAQDGSGSGIRLQLLNALGQPIGTEIRVNNAGTGDQFAPQVSTLAGGGFVVTWESSDPAQDGSGYAIKARVFAADGTALGGEFLVNTAATLDQRQPSVTYLADGGFVVAWHTTDTAQDGSGWAIKAQRFDAAGTKLGSEFLVNTSAFGSQNNVDLTTLSDGRFVATWQYGNTAGSESFARIYNADGTPASAQITLSATGANSVGVFNTAVTALANGGFAVAFQNFDGIAYEFYNAAGQVTVPRTFLSLVNGTGFSPEITTLADGRVLIEYVSGGAHYARVLSAAGAVDGAEFMTTPGKLGHVVVGLANGNFAALETSFVDGQDIGFQLFKPNAAPELGAPTKTFSNGENLTYAGGAFATDDGGPSPLTYTIIGGADAAKFTISATTGSLTYKVAPDYEAPGDANGDNVYEVTVRVSDGELTDTQTLYITVTNQNEAPVITSNGAGVSAAFTVSEGASVATTVVAADPENAVLTYSISGGTDAALFTINAATGVLSFVAAPNFEAPADSNGDNVYAVTVRVSDGVFADTQALTITVGNVNEAPVITSTAAFNAAENGTAVGTVLASDPDGTALTYAIAGGADAALFTINAATGVLSFIAAPDFEAPGDADGNGVYQVTIAASDGSLVTVQAISVTVGNVNETPHITTPSSMTVAENSTAAGTVGAADPEGGALTYTISGGADAARFVIDSVTGALTFAAAPDREAPADADGDNVYQVTVTASDGVLSDSQSVSVTVADVDEAPAFISTGSFATTENTLLVGSVAAADPEGAALSYAIVGGADAALFTIDPVSGQISFVSAPDYEAPGDADGNNSYAITVRASDGNQSSIQAVTITVGNANEAPVITSQTLFSVNEGDLGVGTVSASDPDGTGVTYSITGGADAARFTINAATGALSFVAAPDYEAAGDAGANNVYDVVVTASDGTLTSSQALAVTVANVNEAPVITSNGGGASAALSVAEGTAGVITTVSASDPEGTARVYTISGGADAARFTINAATGALTFVAAPNYEAPTDANGDNIYQVVVTASDGSLSDSQALAITVTNVNEAPVITSNGGGASAAVTVNENTTAVTTVAGADPDGTALTFTISGGADAARFTINAATGVLSFVAAPNYEAPVDANGDNVYQVVITASDGSLSVAQALSVSIANVADGVTLTGTSKANTLTGTVAEDSLYGLGGNDTLNGGGGADLLDGGDGNDVLIGGAGADVLTGGLGADTFTLQALADSTAALADFITDFSSAQADKISLSAIDANTALSGDQAFSWIGTAAFTGVAGQLRYYQQGGDTYVTGDVNGDGQGDFLIQIDPLLTLKATDFVL